MYKLKNSWIIIFLLFFITTLSASDNSLKIIGVQGAIKPTVETDIVIGIDFAHQNNISASEITNLTTILNTTFSPDEVVFIRESFSSDSLLAIDVLAILAPTTSYSELEIEVTEDFIEKGNSLFIATGYRNQTEDPINDLLNPFGLHFNLSSSLIPENVREQRNQTVEYYETVRNFTTPQVPVIENMSQIAYVNGIGISFNESKLETYQSPNILIYNPILLKYADKDPSENNSLASTLEFENGARIFAIGSSDMFNNTYIEPLANTTSLFLDNTGLILNAIKWLGRNTGIMNFYDAWVDLDELSISKDQVIHGNVSLLNSLNDSLPQTQIIIGLERDGHILNSRIMRVDPNNASKYFGWVSTENLEPGWCDVVFYAKHIGYLPIEIAAGRVYIKPPFPTALLPNIAIWGLFLAVVILFATTAFLVRTNLYKK